MSDQSPGLAGGAVSSDQLCASHGARARHGASATYALRCRAPQRVGSASEAAGFRGSYQLERRPSSPGLDHGWCVYSKLRQSLLPSALCFCRAPTAFHSLHTKKNVNGVHNIFPVFTSFLSPLDYTCSSQRVYTHTSTLGHITTPLYATHHR